MIKTMPVQMRKGQTIQCCYCLKMKSEVRADLDIPFTFYCPDCLAILNTEKHHGEDSGRVR